eukprot:scaffold46867_cov153-Amphora_coffeaeformis.AAC.2
MTLLQCDVRSLPAHLVKVSFSFLGLAHGRHGHAAQIGRRIVRPVGRNCLQLGIKVHTGRTVKVEITANTLLVAGKGKHGQGNGDGDIDTHLSTFDIHGKFARRRTRRRKESTSVTVRIIIDNLHGLFEGIGGQDGQYGSKDFFGIRHILGIGDLDHGGPDKVPVGIIRHLQAPSIQQYLRSLLFGLCDDGFDACFGFGSNERSHFDTGHPTGPHF